MIDWKKRAQKLEEENKNLMIWIALFLSFERDHKIFITPEDLRFLDYSWTISRIDSHKGVTLELHTIKSPPSLND